VTLWAAPKPELKDFSESLLAPKAVVQPEAIEPGELSV
jgi:hypothetical protein